MRWYNNNTLINVTSAQGECTYDSPITLPTNPTKPGYKFNGWKVRPEYDFSTLPTNSNGTHRYAKGIDLTNNADYCRAGEGGSSTPAVDCDGYFTDLNKLEYKVIFSWGTIYGMALCSSSVGTAEGQTGSPSESNSGQYCWCKATGYIPNGSSSKYMPLKTLPYVYAVYNSSSPDTNTCNKAGCATRCAYDLDNNPSFRATLFGITQ